MNLGPEVNGRGTGFANFGKDFAKNRKGAWNTSDQEKLVEDIAAEWSMGMRTIGIRLEAFPSDIRKRVVDGQEPLGGILQDTRMPHLSDPRAFFTAKADNLIAEALQETPGAELYGRCNQLSDEEGIVFADIVEILPSNGGTEVVFEA